VLRVIGVIISKQSLGNRKPKKESQEEERRREEIGFFFLFFRLISFSRHGFVVGKIPGAFCFLDLSFFLRALAFRFRVKQ
jgi:hypothetical protein